MLNRQLLDGISGIIQQSFKSNSKNFATDIFYFRFIILKSCKTKQINQKNADIKIIYGPMAGRRIL